LNLAKWFRPDAASATDQDGSIPTLDITFGDIPTGEGFRNRNLVRRMRLSYDLTTSTTATIQGFVGDEKRADQNTFTQLTGEAPATAADDQFEPWTWGVNQNVHYFRPRVVSSGAGTSTIIRGLELDIRPSLR
jgi:hypothetical protein